MTEVATLALYAFGALVFTVLSAFYWRNRGERKRSVLSTFTLVCAAAFLDGLVSQFVYVPGAAAVREFATGLIPPLMLHLVLDGEWRSLRAARGWRVLLGLTYTAAVAFATARVLGVFVLYGAPAVLLGVCSCGGAAALALARRTRSRAEQTYRIATAAVLLLIVLFAAIGQAPDYLVLAFYSITLYYRERLAFFDVLVKLGAFAAAGLAALATYVSARPETPWTYGAALLGCWLAGAALYPILSRAIDRLWLRRPFSAADAERRFIRGIQGAADEQDLAARASASLTAIFQAPADVRFAGPEPDIALSPRPDGVPFLSDDRRLLQSLTGTLSVVLENVRFREREHELRLLATRAELKALRAQINPHFLFNSLSVIAGLIESQPSLADETIEHLAHVFRYTLRKSESEWTPLAEEVEFVRAYLRIEQARFGDRLQTAIDIDPAAASIAVPAMCIQPIVENAIRHGLSVVPGPGRVSLMASLVDGELRIEVADTGPGFPPQFELATAAEGHGLRNVAGRVRGYYGEAARLSWTNDGGGARVTLALPVAALRVTGSACA